MNLTPDEQTLIEHLRTLTFTEVADTSIIIESAMTRHRHFNKDSYTGNIIKLSMLLTNASEAYKKESSVLEQD